MGRTIDAANQRSNEEIRKMKITKNDKEWRALLAKIQGRKHPSCYECTCCHKTDTGYTCAGVGKNINMSEKEILLDHNCGNFVEEEK